MFRAHVATGRSMINRSWLPSAGEAAHRRIVGFGLAIIALVAFGYGATILTTASAATPTTLLSGVVSMLVCVGALAWLASLVFGSPWRT